MSSVHTYASAGTYTIKVKNDLGNIGKTITATGNFKKDLNSSVSISTGVVENKIIPTTKAKIIKKIIIYILIP